MMSIAYYVVHVKCCSMHDARSIAWETVAASTMNVTNVSSCCFKDAHILAWVIVAASKMNVINVRE